MTKKANWGVVALGAGLLAAGLLFLPDELVAAPLGIGLMAFGSGYLG